MHHKCHESWPKKNIKSCWNHKDFWEADNKKIYPKRISHRRLNIEKSAVNWATIVFVKLKYFSLTNAMKFSWNWFPENKVKFISSYREMHMHTTLYMYIFFWRFRCKSCIMILNCCRENQFHENFIAILCENNIFLFQGEKNLNFGAHCDLL